MADCAKHKDLVVGRRYSLINRGMSTCDECGSASYLGVIEEVVYEGHTVLRRYGQVGVFRRLAPLVCPSCGTSWNRGVEMCDGGAISVQESLTLKLRSGATTAASEGPPLYFCIEDSQGG